MTGKVKHINPDGLMKNPTFLQVITTQGSGKTIYIGGQNSVNANHELVGKGNLQAQTDQIMQNIQIALSDCNATFDHIVKLNILYRTGTRCLQRFPSITEIYDINFQSAGASSPLCGGINEP